MDKGKNLAIGTKDELKQMIKKSESISIDILDPVSYTHLSSGVVPVSSAMVFTT